MTEEQDEIVQEILVELRDMRCKVLDGVSEKSMILFNSGYTQAKIDIMFKILEMKAKK